MKNIKIDFSNQKMYVGIDVHKKNWSVTIVFQGMHLKTMSFEPSPEKLANYLKREYPKAEYYSVYEAGFCGFWIDRRLREHGIKNIVVSPSDIPRKSKERIRKTDQIDSRKLARELSVGNLEGIYIPTEEQQSLRSLMRLRMQLTKDQARMKNRIKSFLNFMGIEIPEEEVSNHWSRNYINYLYNLQTEYRCTSETLKTLIDSLIQIRGQITGVVKNIRSVVFRQKETAEVIDRLMSVPGIGFITAVSLYTEIMDMRRFNRIDELATYVGFSPAVYSSGEKEKTLGLSKQRNKYIRNLLIEAAWIAVREDPALTLSFGMLAQRMPKSKAIIKISKKLLNRIRYVWIRETVYQKSVAA